MRLIILGALLLAACAGITTNNLQTPYGPLYSGMSADDVDDIMGPPHYVGTGSSYFRNKFFMLTGGWGSVEWAWELKNGDVVVVWMQHGTVSFIGTVKADKRNKNDPIRGAAATKGVGPKRP